MIRDNLMRYVIAVVGVTFGLFLFALFSLPQTVQSEIDAELNQLALAIVDEANSKAEGRVNLTEMQWPDALQNSYQAGGSFYVVMDAEGKIVHHSPNLPKSESLYATYNEESTEPSFEFVNKDNNQRMRVLHLPLIGQYEDTELSQLTGYLQVGRMTNDYGAYQRLTYMMLMMGGAALCISYLTLKYLLPRALRPLDQIVDVANQITTADDLSRRIPVSGGDQTDEIGRLTIVLNRLISRLERLFLTQQRLLADVSHELRTPLTAIGGTIDVIRRTGEADRESLNAIDDETTRMSRLVSDLLTLARAEAGGLPIQRKVLDIDRVFLKAYEQVSMTNKSVPVILEEVEPVKVIGDADRLTQLFLNLMTNAVKYSNVGDRVRVALREIGDAAVITVMDAGIGIPAEDLEHIFDRFYRVNKARTRERGGSGLGLAIAKSIVDAHGGSILAESTVGVGSTFTVTIPVFVKESGQELARRSVNVPAG